MATFIRLQRFTLVSREECRYAVPGNALLDKPQVGLILNLRIRTARGLAGPSVRVLNTHLIYNPKRGDVKLLQIGMLLNRPAPAVAGPAALVLCGDFNATPSSPLIRFVRDGVLPHSSIDRRLISGQERSSGGGSHGRYTTGSLLEHQPPGISMIEPCEHHQHGGRAHGYGRGKRGKRNQRGFPRGYGDTASNRGPCYQIRHPLQLVSAMPLLPDSPPTTWHHDFKGIVDYIWYDPSELIVLDHWQLVSGPVLDAVGGIPTHDEPSDHQMIAARFGWAKPTTAAVFASPTLTPSSAASAFGQINSGAAEKSDATGARPGGEADLTAIRDSTRTIGTVVIGETPRPDLTAPLTRLGLHIVEAGALDGVLPADRPVVPVGGGCPYPLVTRLRGGQVVWLAEPALAPFLGRAATAVAAAASAGGRQCIGVLVMCAGTFAGLNQHYIGTPPLVQPFELAQRELHQRGLRRLLVLCPAGQANPISDRWRNRGFDVAWAREYACGADGSFLLDPDDVAAALKTIADSGPAAEAVLVDYVGCPALLDLGHDPTPVIDMSTLLLKEAMSLLSSPRT